VGEAGAMETNFQQTLSEMRLTYVYNHLNPDYQVVAQQDF
jgi:hypothetical protein